MKHTIDAPAGSAEFRRRFRRIRDAFVKKLDAVARAHGVKQFRACTRGKPRDWIWTPEGQRLATGTLADAKGFTAYMIDEGMELAFMLTGSGEAATIWLTAWEAPEKGPRWPRGTRARMAEVHEGVEGGRSPRR